MVFTCFAFPNSFILQAGKRWQHINRWLDAFAVQVAAEDNLPFCNITGKVWNRVGFIIFRHGQDRNQRNGAFLAFLASGTLIKGSKVGVHVAGISAASGDFLAGGGNFTQCVRIVCNVRHDDKNVHVFLKGKIFCRRQCHARCCNALDGWIICKVDKQDGPVNSTSLSKALDKEIGFLKSNTHCSEHNGKRFSRSDYCCLPCNLRRELRMGQAGSRKNRKLLPADKRI